MELEKITVNMTSEPLSGLKQNGFSLIELLVVIVIMAVTVMFVVPKLGANTRMNLNAASRKLAGTIIYVRNEVIFMKRDLKLKYSFEDNTYSINELTKMTEGFAGEEYEEKDIRTFPLPEGVSFMDVSTTYGGKLNFGDAYTHFYTSGMVERTFIHLTNDKDDVKTLEVNVLTGEVDLHDGYHDETSLL